MIRIINQVFFHSCLQEKVILFLIIKSAVKLFHTNFQTPCIYMQTPHQIQDSKKRTETNGQEIRHSFLLICTAEGASAKRNNQENSNLFLYHLREKKLVSENLALGKSDSGTSYIICIMIMHAHIPGSFGTSTTSTLSYKLQSFRRRERREYCLCVFLMRLFIR